MIPDVCALAHRLAGWKLYNILHDSTNVAWVGSDLFYADPEQHLLTAINGGLWSRWSYVDCDLSDVGLCYCGIDHRNHPLLLGSGIVSSMSPACLRTAGNPRGYPRTAATPQHSLLRNHSTIHTRSLSRRDTTHAAAATPTVDRGRAPR